MCLESYEESAVEPMLVKRLKRFVELNRKNANKKPPREMLYTLHSHLVPLPPSLLFFTLHLSAQLPGCVRRNYSMGSKWTALVPSVSPDRKQSQMVKAVSSKVHYR